jgi:N-acetylglucosaminyl-diphospho-decaprenol L-rhamnosyltransferase
MAAGTAPAVEQERVDRPSVPDVDVVIVSYRCRESGLRISTVLVDNDSRDGTAQAVRRRFPRVDVVANGWNSGFSFACNMGMARGRGRYVLLLNPDTIAAEDALCRMVAFADAQPRAGVVAPRLLNADGTDQQTARSFPTPASAVLGRRSPLTRIWPGNRWSRAYLTAGRRTTSTPFQVDWVSGAAMLVRRQVVAEVGGLDEGFFLFWEDADWCRRITAAGHEVWCVPAAEVIHDEGGSRAHGWSPRTIRWFHQGAYRYWRKHHAPSPWNPLRWAAAALLTVRAVVLTVHHGLPTGTTVRPLQSRRTV